MQLINPKQANKIVLVYRTDGDVVRSRVLGYFSISIYPDDILFTLQKNNLDLEFKTADLDGEIEVHISNVSLSKGVIFDTLDEAINCLKSGLTPDELYDMIGMINV